MTPSPRVWIATFVALVFVIGAMAGIVIDRTWLLPERGPRSGLFGMGPGAGGGPGPGPGLGPGGGRGPGSGPGRMGAGPALQNPDALVADLDRQLNLSDEQESAVRKILEDWRPRLQELQNTSRRQFNELQEQLLADIAKALTEEQAEKFRTMGGRGRRGR
jgi:hypothetical protein